MINKAHVSPPRVAHIITDLNGFGGTEATLFRYLKGSGIPLEFHRVIVLKTIGGGNTLGAQMVAAGFFVVELNQKKGVISIKGLKDVYREIKAFDPDVISGWLYHPCLLATIFALLTKRRPRVVWHIRSLTFSSLLKTPGRYIVQRVLAMLSHVTKPLIVSNSTKAIQEHVSMGFSVHNKQRTIIPNGIDLSEYFPDRREGLVVRNELGIPDNAILIGCIGRFAFEKGYPVFFDALKLVREKLPPELAKHIHFLGVGSGVSLINIPFKSIASGSLEINKLHLLDMRADVPRLLRGLDVFVLPSLSEAFPNALVEAMASGLACIATDVGECGEVLVNQNYIVPPSDSIQLAARIIQLVEMPVDERLSLGIDNRRVVNQYRLSKMVRSFDELFYAAVQ